MLTSYFGYKKSPKKVLGDITECNLPLDTPVEHFKVQLRKDFLERQSNKELFDENFDVEEDNADANALNEAELSNIQVVRKENIFSERETENELGIIQQRVEIQQRQFEKFQKRELNRKIAKIQHMYDVVTPEEATLALDEHKGDEEAVILKFTENDYLHSLRKRIALAANPSVSSAASRYMTKEQREAYEELRRKRGRTLKKTTSAEAKASYDMCRLRLDDALAQLSTNPEKGMEGWSDARIRAFQQIGVNPNAYYYRFNAPGEPQKNGAWTREERDLFFVRLQELGANGQWGVFSMTIPGRVGYQCANFYRRLVEHKEIEDPNYYVDEKGNCHYLFSGKKDPMSGALVQENDKYVIQRPRRLTTDGDVSPAMLSRRRSAKKATSKRKRRRHSLSDDEDDDDGEDAADGSYHSKARWATTARTKSMANHHHHDQPIPDGDDEADEDYQQSSHSHHVSTNAGDESEVEMGTRAYLNPLPGFVDPITLEEVRKPAISPDGHVMSYDNWIRCLVYNEPKNICPFTKKLLYKRELVLLTPDNIHAYRDRIVKLT